MKGSYKNFVLIISSFLLCSGWVFYAAFGSLCEADGGRGGALTVALSFLALFIGRDYSSRVERILTKKRKRLSDRIKNHGSTEDVATNTRLGKIERGAEDAIEQVVVLEKKVDQLSRQIAGFIGRINTFNRQQKFQNYVLAFTSVLGTIFWGFGDIFAGWMITSGTQTC